MTRVLHRLVRLLPLIAFALLGLAGCGQVPVSTQWKLRQFDALTFDPAEPRAAIIVTERLRALPGGAKIMFRHWLKGDEAAKSTEVFVLQETGEPVPAAVAKAAPEGSRVSIFRFAAGDVARIRRLQARFAELKRTAPGSAGTEVKADIDACRSEDLPEGPIAGTLFLKLDSANGYLPVLENLDLRALAAGDGKTLEELTRPCPAPAKKS